MTSVISGLRDVVDTVATVVRAAGIGIAALINGKAHRERMTRNRTAVDDSLPVNSQWWRDHAKVKGELVYVAIGDSAAQGIGASAPHRSYVGILADRLRGASGRTVRVINLSVSGATVALAVQDQLPRFARLKPDVVTVAIGANDIGLWDAETFGAGIRTLFQALPEHAIVADLPCFHLPRNERKVAAANRLLRERAAERGLTVVPLHAITKRQGMRSIATQFANDLFHPNDRGYRVWADAFLPTLTADIARRFPSVPAAEASTVGGRR